MPTRVAPLDTGVQIPYHFRCPISLELMCDPVTVATGQTYDRLGIESWVATGNTTCPVTRVPLNDFTLIPNHNLRRLIQEWCVANKSHGVERIPTPKQPADPTHVRALLDQLSLSSSAPAEPRLAALRSLRALARDSDKNRSLMSSQGAQPALLSIFLAHTNVNELVLESLALLVMFPLSETECISLAAQSDRLAFIVSLLEHPSIEVRVNAATLIECIVSGSRTPELQLLFGETKGIFDGLVKILNHPLTYPKALKVGVKVLFSLCLVKPNRGKAVAAGAASALVDRLADFEKCDVERALATIELLCRVPRGCAAFGAHALTVPLLVKIILKLSDRATEYATGALLSLCSESEHLQRDAVSAGVVTQLLLLVQSDCTERAKRKAQLLLKLLRDAWPRDSIANSNDFGCSDVVPF
ncbi:U-box domain-containing protein 26-like [Aristolochia californica]|uniref:U-box domain-containing protein 26-like n=1 Tax=Aristolochia californica TaxID=171875 RepID=UPI0035D99D39